jgi:FtsH-binding integral membrane protein
MSTNKKSASKAESKPQQPMLFAKENYILIIASLVILVVGFMLMSGKTDIYNSTKLTVAPIVVILGFILGIVAIFYRKKSE